MNDNELVGLFEVAKLARVTPSAVANWRKRALDFPAPVADLKSGPVFQLSHIRAWLRKRRVPMATVIATINLKGGVGKSTTTVAVGEMMSASFGKKVLIIDLDPQTNATTMLIGEEQWQSLNDEGKTLAQLFKDALEPEDNKRRFSIDAAIQKHVSNVADVRTLDLLPSSLDLIDVQDRLASMPSGRFYAANPTDILKRVTRNILDNYDVVLIDCPPNLGIITLNGLRISHGYIIPTIPDVLSTYGIPQIVKRVGQFSETIGEKIEPYGIVVSKYREQSTTHRNTIRQMQHRSDAPLFNTIIPENDKAAEAAEYKPVSTLRQKWGYRGQYDLYKTLTGEIMERAGILNLKKTLRALGAVVLEEVDRNPDFAKRMLNALGESEASDSKNRASSGKRRGRTAALIDPIAVMAVDGEDVLRQALAPLDLEKLLDIVAEFGMDPAKLVMKWKDARRVIDHIVESAKRRSTKGDAFRA